MSSEVMGLSTKRFCCLAGWPLALMLTVSVASAGPVAPATPDAVRVLPHFDKIVHFFVFGLLATLILRSVSGGVGALAAAVIAVGVTSLFGLADEFHQSTNPVRFFSWWDWVADTAGAVVAVAAYCGWAAYRRALESRIRPVPLRRRRSALTRERSLSLS